jgi:hypothetical protein
MNSMYNAQYREYLTWFDKDSEGVYQIRDAVTEKQKKILRIKKSIFVELHPLLDAYAIYASTARSPEGFDMRIVEERIMDLLNRLLHLTLGGQQHGPNLDFDDLSRNSEGSSSDSPTVWGQ